MEFPFQFDTIDILALSLLAINFLVYLPCTVICTLRISKHCSLPHFHKRYPLLLYNIIIFASLYLLIERTFYILTYIVQCSHIRSLLSLIHIPSTAKYLSFIDAVLSCCTILICSLFFLQRTWMLYFDHNYHLGRSDGWRRNVGSLDERRQSFNWFDRNKFTLGKSSFMHKLMLVAWLCITTSTLCTLYFVQHSAHLLPALIYCVLLFIFVCLLIYLIHGIQSEWDFVHIRSELCWDLLLIISATITYMAISTLFNVHDMDQRLKCLATSFVLICCVYGIVYMSVGFPLNTWSSQNKRERSMSQIFPGRSARKLPLVALLKDAEAFEAFMLHLVQEFAVENLLFICELMQFKQHLQAAIVKPTEDDQLTEQEWKPPTSTSGHFITELPMDIIPKSSLIKYAKSYLAAARNIYEKYIENGSEFEINISSRTRRELIDFFNIMYPHNPEDLYHTRFEPQIKANNIDNAGGQSSNSFCLHSSVESVASLQTQQYQRRRDKQLHRKNELSDHIVQHILNSPNLEIILDDDRIEKSVEASLKLITEEDEDENEEQEEQSFDEDLDAMVNTLQFKDSNYEQVNTEKEISSHLGLAFDGPSELDLFAVFDHAKEEIFAILNDSYQRFACSERYTEIEPKILKNLHKKQQCSQSSTAFGKRSSSNLLSGAKMLLKQVSPNAKPENTASNLTLGIELNIHSSASTHLTCHSGSRENLSNYSPTLTWQSGNNTQEQLEIIALD